MIRDSSKSMIIGTSGVEKMVRKNGPQVDITKYQSDGKQTALTTQGPPDTHTPHFWYFSRGQLRQLQGNRRVVVR